MLKHCVHWKGVAAMNHRPKSLSYECDSDSEMGENVFEFKKQLIVSRHDTKRVLDYKVLRTHEQLWKEVESAYNLGDDEVDNIVTVVKPIRYDERLHRGMPIILEKEKAKVDAYDKMRAQLNHMHRSVTTLNLEALFCETDASCDDKAATHETKKEFEQPWGYFVKPKVEDCVSRRKLF